MADHQPQRTTNFGCGCIVTETWQTTVTEGAYLRIISRECCDTHPHRVGFQEVSLPGPYPHLYPHLLTGPGPSSQIQTKALS